MIKSKIILLFLLIVSSSILNCIKLELVNDQTWEGELMRTTEESIYIKNNKLLIIFDQKLVTTEVPSFSGKLNYNSFHEIISINSQTDFDKLPKFENSSENKRAIVAGVHSFIFLECSTMLNGLSVGFNYEFAFSPFATISLGYNKGASFHFFILSIYDVEYTTFPIALKLVPGLNTSISPEVGFSVEYVKWKTFEQSIFSGEKVLVDEDNEFMTSILIGVRYQPSTEGFAMKSGGKLLFDHGEIGLSLYLDLGVKF